MHALLFDVLPNEGHEKRYFDHVNRLKPVLAEHEGLLWIDRFRCDADSRKLLSLQLWQDEAAIVGWRNDRQHHAVQKAGREVHFEDYRIRVAQLTMRIDGGNLERFETGAGDGDMVLVMNGEASFKPSVGRILTSVNHEGAIVAVADGAVAGLMEQFLQQNSSLDGFRDGYVARVIRDYTLTDRAQAPQDWS